MENGHGFLYAQCLVYLRLIPTFKDIICFQSVTKIFAVNEVVQILQTFSLHARNYLVNAERYLFKLLMENELGSEVSINLLVSVLGSAGEMCSVV